MESAAYLYLSLSFFVCPNQTPFSQDFQRGERDKDRMALADFFWIQTFGTADSLIASALAVLGEWSLLLVAWRKA